MEQDLVIGYGGRYGGYKLNADSSETTIYDVYLALTKNSFFNDEAMTLNKTDQLMTKILTVTEGEFGKILENYTIADIQDTFQSKKKAHLTIQVRC